MKRWASLATATLALTTALVTGTPKPPEGWSTDLLVKYGNPDALLIAQRVYRGWKTQDPGFEMGVATAGVRRRLFSTPFDGSVLPPDYCTPGEWSAECFRRGNGEFLGMSLEHMPPHGWIAVDVAWFYCELRGSRQICVSNRQGVGF